jgi:serine protease
MRAVVWLVLAAAVSMTLASAQSAEVNRVATHPRSSSHASVVLPLIVKLRGPPSAPSAATPAGISDEDRIQRVASRAGLLLEHHHSIAGRLHLLRITLPSSSASTESAAAAVLAQLRSDPDIEYAVPDERRYVHVVPPNDPLYAQQWVLQRPANAPSAIDAFDAWSISTGSNGLVIADIDTGVRSEHPDLSARLLPGYCFISDAFISNGGSCPGPGAEDPGDWVTSADLSQSECNGQSAGPSSWHGTRVAGILGAATNNSLGIAGLTWSGQILPVRVLGKCGGFDSDIITGMLWAAGIPVAGAPTNSNPAKIINLSLGGTGSCPQSYQDAIGQIAAVGALVIVSAGNEGGPVDAPADCLGVAGVVGLRQAGTKVGYSNLGPQIALAAPAGNCVNALAEQPCLYTIPTTTNLGSTTADANDYTGEYYCDQTSGSYPNCSLANANQYRTYNVGTSFAAPLVSGIAALMSTVNSNLNSCALITRLQQTATQFPQSSATSSTVCHVPSDASDVQNSECICTNDSQTCGAGMANAAAALAAALRPVAAVALPGSVSANQPVALDASGSKAANASSISSYSWTNLSGAPIAIQNAHSAKAIITAPSCRMGTVQVTVTDNAGLSDNAQVVVTPSSVSSSAPATASGSSTCSFAKPVVQVKVCPTQANLQAGASGQSFTADVANSVNTAVTWEVNGIAGGNASVGTVSSAGDYTPPASLPASSTVTITAVSAANASITSSAQVMLSARAATSHSGGGAIDWISLALLSGAAVSSVLQRRRS